MKAIGEKDAKRQPIIIEGKGLSLLDKVRQQTKTLRDFLEAEMPERGWFHNKGVCCYYDDMPMMFTKCSSLYAEFDSSDYNKETQMFLLVSILHPHLDLCHACYIKKGNKRELLEYLAQETTIKRIYDAILQMNNSMKEKS